MRGFEERGDKQQSQLSIYTFLLSQLVSSLQFTLIRSSFLRSGAISMGAADTAALQTMDLWVYSFAIIRSSLVMVSFSL